MNNHRGIIVSIILCGVLVFSGLFCLAAAINNKMFASTFPSAISVDTGNNQLDYGDYMYLDMAANYVGVFDINVFQKMLLNGAFYGTYTTYRSSTKVEYIFSKEKLDIFMTQKIESGESLQ